MTGNCVYKVSGGATLKSMSKLNRIDLRVDAELKARFTEAAASLGMSLSAFMVAAAREQLVRTEKQRQALTLSQRDRERFLEALERSPRSIPAAMERAKRRHGRLIGD